MGGEELESLRFQKGFEWVPQSRGGMSVSICLNSCLRCLMLRLVGKKASRWPAIL